MPEEYRSAFAEEVRGRTARGVWALTVVGLLLFPAFSLLDAMMYPQEALLLGGIRLATSAALSVLLFAQFLVRRRGNAGRWSGVFVYGLVAIISAGLDAVILVAGGLESPYYAGMGLTLIGIIAAIPWGPLPMAILLALIVAQLDVVMLLGHAPSAFPLVVSANFFLISTALIGLLGATVAHQLRVGEFIGRRRIEQEKARSESLLLNILPAEVADELKSHGRVQARHIPSCTILFSDFVGFTEMSRRVDPGRLVQSLDEAFSRFDLIMTRWGVEKLKTIGDAYMCAGGVLGAQPDHLVACMLAGLEMLDVLERGEVRAPDGTPWNMRLGIHSGPVVAGVIGARRFAYDLWGDTVNTASRLESTAQPRTLNLATEVFVGVADFFIGEPRGFVPVRGRGPVEMTRVLRIRPELSDDVAGRVPNAQFFALLEDWLSERGQADRPRMVTRPAAEARRATLESGVDPLRTFAMLTEADRAGLMDVADLVPVPEGKVLIEEGQGLSVLFLVLEGLFAVRVNRDGVDIEVATLGPGEIAGELSFVSLEPASATVVALQDGQALRFDLDRVQSQSEASPGLGARLFHSFSLVLAQRLRETNARLFSARIGDDGASTRRPPPDLVAIELPPALQTALRQLQQRLAPLADQSVDHPVEAQRQVDYVFDDLLRALDVHLGDDGGGVSGARGAAVLREGYRFLMRSSLLRSCHVHADGCASDHVAVDAILSRMAPSADPLGRLIDSWFLGESVARAMRESTRFLADWLCARDQSASGRWRVASLSCGAAPELFDLLSRAAAPAELRLSCLDPELRDLAHVGRLAAGRGARDRFSFCRVNVLTPRTARAPLRLAPQDVIYHPLLGSLLDDDELVGLIEELIGLLAPGGVLVIGQFHLPPAMRTFLHHVLGWPIRARSVADLESLMAHTTLGPAAVRQLHADDGLWSFSALGRD